MRQFIEFIGTVIVARNSGVKKSVSPGAATDGVTVFFPSGVKMHFWITFSLSLTSEPVTSWMSSLRRVPDSEHTCDQFHRNISTYFEDTKQKKSNSDRWTPKGGAKGGKTWGNLVKLLKSIRINIFIKRNFLLSELLSNTGLLNSLRFQTFTVIVVQHNVALVCGDRLFHARAAAAI